MFVLIQAKWVHQWWNSLFNEIHLKKNVFKIYTVLSVTLLNCVFYKGVNIKKKNIKWFSCASYGYGICHWILLCFINPLLSLLLSATVVYLTFLHSIICFLKRNFYVFQNSFPPHGLNTNNSKRKMIMMIFNRKPLIKIKNCVLSRFYELVKNCKHEWTSSRSCLLSESDLIDMYLACISV